MASTTGTSTEDSDRTPMRSPQAGEEEEEAVTPIPAGTPTGLSGIRVQSPPASDITGFGIEATDPDDESRPVTKQEFTRFRRRVEKTFQRMHLDVIGLQQNEVDEHNRQRDTLK